MKIHKTYNLLFLSLSCISVSCHENLDEPGIKSQTPVSFELEMATNPYVDFNFDENSGTGLDPIGYYFHPGQSVLLISQRGENFEPFSSVNTAGIYKYTYYVNDEADWDYGYNFEPYDGNALDWETIKNYQFQGNYGFGALFYPIENNTVTSVMADQSDYNNFLRSDILGTYHLTSQLKSRLRFRLFHLMACMDVKLWVPEWNPEDNTGFDDNAVCGAQMPDMIRNFEIIWGNTSTEVAPTVQLPVESSRIVSVINLYSIDGESSRPVVTKELPQPDPNSSWTSDPLPDSDNIREYHYRVLFPAQTLSSSLPIFRFTLTRNGKQHSYTFSMPKRVNGSFSIASGTMNNLTLYLPRFENHAIMVKSEIIDWTEGESEFSAMPRQ